MNSNLIFLNLRESQTIEFKESWRDEYLKTVCAFANTNGGTFDLTELIRKGILKKVGTSGEGIRYYLVGH